MRSALYAQESGGESGGVDDDDDRSIDSLSSSSSYTSAHGSDGDSSEFSESRQSGSKSDGAKLAQTETKFVLCSKFMAYLVLFLSACAMGFMAFHFARQEEIHEFEENFNIYARDVELSSRASMQSKVEVARSLALGVTSYAKDRNREFPSVTLPNFEARAQKAMHLSQAEIITWSPLVEQALRRAWENYTVHEGPIWLRNSMDYMGFENEDIPAYSHMIQDTTMQPVEGPYFTGDESLSGQYLPIWQAAQRAELVAPPKFLPSLNQDLLAGSVATRDSVEVAYDLQAAVLSPMFQAARTVVTDTQPEFSRSYISSPVFSKFTPDAVVVGMIGVLVPWQRHFEMVLPPEVAGVELVISDSCGSMFTLLLNGQNVELRGEGDLHDTEFNSMRQNWTIGHLADEEDAPFYVVDNCLVIMDMYPTKELEDEFLSNMPIMYAIAVAVIFVFTAFVFLVYDWAVQLRQNKVLKTATRTQAIVSSLFPKNVQERIFKDVEEEVKREDTKAATRFRGNRTKDQLRTFLADGSGNEEQAQSSSPANLKSKPIADLFPEATVIFADIVGFTAWSSTREPTQVFTLLENIYHSFDEIAKRRRIFKVETVGDCYVAVSGLPEPRKDHAVAMARFARDILHKFGQMVKAMVVELGPDTEDLGLRVGLHSGPVTAGVLRGERARFQLFGDTMNTAARMESTGSPNRIQMSQDTADLLTAGGKSQWLTARREKVNAKGKGELQTFWLEPNDSGGTKSATSATLSQTESGDGEAQSPSAAAARSSSNEEGAASAKAASHATDKHMRLISWNTDILARLLTQIIAGRESRNVRPDSMDAIKTLEEKVSRTRLVLSEVTEIITLPKFQSGGQKIDASRIELSEEVVTQLRDYVQTLAAMYRENPFHNFEHASHVTMSVLKLLSRIVAPADLQSDTDKTLHDHTYGITSDPMTQFAVVLSALIHDADHPGVPNTQLIKENASIASVYKNKSIAEQNSVDLAWDLLMDDAYVDLRRAIYVTEDDFLRFRQLVVNIVLATDIMDKDLGALRKGRWNKAFSEAPLDESAEVAQNRKATIVMEHLIQASDVAHTMQHWHIYRKWNQRLFLEMYKAYAEGRAEKDPSESWYEGEKGFFDFYIIPLAKKLKDCGVFGVSSDEYLQYAQQNRKEWELKGHQVTAEMTETAKMKGFGGGTRIECV